MFERTTRNWGYYIVLYRSKTLCVKILVFDKDAAISNQRHQFRSEFWLVLLGWGVMIGRSFNILRFLSKYTIKPNQWHQFQAKSECVVLEIQYGSDVRETDIERAS